MTPTLEGILADLAKYPRFASVIEMMAEMIQKAACRQLLAAIVEEMERIHVHVPAPYEKCAQYRDLKDRLAAASKGE